MSITPHAVKELREKTNAGMMDCKKALEEAKGNMDQAVEILRKRGLSIARKKSARAAGEGLLGSFADNNGKLACLVEVNCETDFVARNEDFQAFVSKMTQTVREKNYGDIEALRATVQDTLTALIAKIGENLRLKRFVRWEAASNEKLGLYLHAGSKIGVLVGVSDNSGKAGTDAAKEIAMHVAAMNPGYLRREEIPADVLDKEREIQRTRIDTKKPVEIQNKIVEGKLNRFYSEVCLEEQIFVKDPEGKKSVGAWLKNVSPTARIERFVRLQVGA